MQLKRWLAKERMTQYAFARLTGIDRSNVNRYCDGSRVPSFETVEVIAKYTNGEVMANDFMRKARPRKAIPRPRVQVMA